MGVLKFRRGRKESSEKRVLKRSGPPRKKLCTKTMGWDVNSGCEWVCKELKRRFIQLLFCSGVGFVGVVLVEW